MLSSSTSTSTASEKGRRTSETHRAEYGLDQPENRGRHEHLDASDCASRACLHLGSKGEGWEQRQKENMRRGSEDSRAEGETRGPVGEIRDWVEASSSLSEEVAAGDHRWLRVRRVAAAGEFLEVEVERRRSVERRGREPVVAD